MTENNLKQNSSRCDDRADVLRSLKKKILLRAALIIVTVLLTGVLLFTLTAAWYNNVVGGGGLTFSAKQWNFNGTINVGEKAIEMAPGDSGIISMQIRNDGQEIAAASVTVSKENFNEMMRRRVYFYVETPYYRNGEMMDRVYVSSNSGYAYTVFPDSEINITETSQNAPALKWEWVYDVLGYYVLGTIKENTTVIVEGMENIPTAPTYLVEINEYIRPIEYEYDPILTVFNTDGTLRFVDGIQTANEFMVELSKTDGYVGTIDPQKKTANGYYPVYVNSEGYGVWAYLCTREEIAQNSNEDTQLGQTNPPPAFSATVTVTGSNTKDTAFEVSDGRTLKSLIENSGYTNLKLANSIVLDSAITVSSGSRAYIDLNGYTISGPETPIAGKALLTAEAYSKLTLVNGSLDGNGTTFGVEVIGAEIDLNDVTITGVEEGIKVSDHFNVKNVDSRVRIVDCDIIGSEDAIWIYDLSGDHNAKTTVVIENCRLEGTNYAGIICSGNHNNTDIQINNCEISGYYAAIYHPQQNSVMTISNSTLKGNTGLVVKGGTVNVMDSKIEGLGTISFAPPADNGSGFSDTGDGIYVEGNYAWPTVVNVSGGKTEISSAGENSLAVRLYISENSTAEKKINITGGKFSTDVSMFLTDGATQSEVEGSYVVSLPPKPEENEEVIPEDSSVVESTDKPAGESTEEPVNENVNS